MATVLMLLFAGASSTACGIIKSGDDKPKASPSASPSAKVPTAEELKQGLLVLSDLPTGYSAGEQNTVTSPEPDPTSSVQAGTAECNRLFNEFGGGATQQAGASAEFEKGTTGPFIRQTLESYSDSAALDKSLAQVREAVNKCGQFTVKEQDSEGTVKISNASFPKLGDDTAAFKLEATVTSGNKKITIGGYMIAVKIGNVGNTIISFGVPMADAAETEQITRKAVDKVTPIAK